MIPEEFSNIRPYIPEELPGVYEELLADEEFRAVLAHVLPGANIDEFAQAMRACHTNLEVQKNLIYPLLQMLCMRCTKGVDMDASAIVDKSRRYTFISNHRDIVLDPALLSYLMVNNGFDDTVEIAIGDNLLIRPWIKKVVRVNKSFIVQRALTMRQMLMASATMSRYMHYAVNEKHENVWIAQREGRAKDSDDRTQDSILKMMAMGGEGSVIDRLKHLHIVPLSISYEYDPCDYLKAKEFQMKRTVDGFKKSQQDDLDNMSTGIFGQKGHVHFQMASCIDDWLDAIPEDMPKTEIFTYISRHIDREIHRSYRLYPGNYIAADRLRGDNAFAAYYTESDVKTFDAYVNAQLAKIDMESPDHDYLLDRILTMYANPAINHQEASE